MSFLGNDGALKLFIGQDSDAALPLLQLAAYRGSIAGACLSGQIYASRRGDLMTVVHGVVTCAVCICVVPVLVSIPVFCVRNMSAGYA